MHIGNPAALMRGAQGPRTGPKLKLILACGACSVGARHPPSLPHL